MNYFPLWGGKKPKYFLHMHNVNLSFCRIPHFELNKRHSGGKEVAKMDASSNYAFAFELPWKPARLCSCRVDVF